ncbi:MAG TPA: hypothetical protein VFO55_07650 [Gemmatimonadaceae bacterium]|nr:hypothetical protein [Gemmatimonadaceae bacterium]
MRKRGWGMLGVAGAALISACASPAQAPRRLSDSAFVGQVVRMSERGGYFDTDNLISNEDSYLHPLTTLRRLGVSGGVYVGVGPDQNFSYVAAVRPRAAFIVDIRRDNLLEHLLFKSIFALSRSRAEYLGLLFGRAVVNGSAPDTASIDSLLARVQRAPADQRAIAGIRARVIARVKQTGMPLSEPDLAVISRFHDAFILEGPALRFSSHGRAPQAGYPDYARLAAERDRAGRQASFLASAASFAFVKDLQDRNLIIPLVGDFAGAHAFRELAGWMRAHGEKLSVLYASNVEQYVVRDGGFETFAKNLERLPRDEKSVVIRSCFAACRGAHPQAVPGYFSVQMVQRVDDLAALRAAGRIRGYFDLVSLGLLQP